jgi:protein SCO1/2
MTIASTGAPGLLSRRNFLYGAAVLPLYADHGRIRPPVPVPDVAVTRQDGTPETLPGLALDHATAVQLMFTGCSATCPIQAAIFQRVQSQIPQMAARKIQLLSLSVDPFADTPAAMRAWLGRFQAGSNWFAAAPDIKDVPLLQDFFGRASGDYADHSTQVNIVDRQGRLVWRTIELPTAEEIAGVLQGLG